MYIPLSVSLKIEPFPYYFQCTIQYMKTQEKMPKTTHCPRRESYFLNDQKVSKESLKGKIPFSRQK